MYSLRRGSFSFARKISFPNTITDSQAIVERRINGGEGEGKVNGSNIVRNVTKIKEKEEKSGSSAIVFMQKKKGKKAA